MSDQQHHIGTPISRVAAYVRIASNRPAWADLVDTAYEPTPDQPRRHDLRVGDLAAVLAALADACDDHEACETCGTAICATCGVGEAADCPADRVHCTSPWCFDAACMDAHRDATQPTRSPA